MHSRINVPDGDVLVHCGDFCGHPYMSHVLAFGQWIESLPHKHKVVIAGNHDIPFEDEPEKARKAFSTAIYLQDSMVEIDGIKFWGAPWQPEFFDWGFNVPRGPKIAAKWDLIPLDTDILLTHGPPKGILDKCPNMIPEKPWVHVGCEDLANAVKRVRPKVHAFGHIHEGYGRHIADGTEYINASICTGNYRPTNLPQILDL